MAEEYGILSNLLFHLTASYHIYRQALLPFPGFARPGLDLLCSTPSQAQT